MTQDNYLNSCSLTLPASSSYAPHTLDPPLPHYSSSQSDSSRPTSEHERRRDDASCSSSPDFRQTVHDLGDFSLTSPSNSSAGTTECLLESSNFADEEVASRPGILTGMDVPASSNSTKFLLDTVTCFSPPEKLKHRASPPPMPHLCLH